MKKRVSSLFLALALCLTLLPTAVYAEDVSGGGTFDNQPDTSNSESVIANQDTSGDERESESNTADTWDGTADTSWYVDHETDTEYHITTAEQLAGLAQLVNADKGKTNFKGKTFYLDNDLDLSGHEWISIGTGSGGTNAEYSFCGTFDGKGHVISNLYSHESYIEGADESHNLLRNALFGNVYDGEVRNLGVADAEIWIDPLDDSAAGKGILVDWLGKSKITNCWTSGTITSGTKIEKNIGGIVGVTVQGCTISGCYSTATLIGNFTNSEGYYTNPEYMDPDTIGGIVGARFDGDLTVTDCWFDGKIVVNSIQAAVGGIVGYADEVNVKNCLVATTDMGADSDDNTCWVAYALDGTVENNYWPDDEKEYDPSPLEFITEGAITAKDQGTAVSDFKSEDVLTGLKKNAGKGINWVTGINHPTFKWDERNTPADYTKVDEAIAKAEEIDGSRYTNYGDVEAAIDAVDRTKSKAEQGKVDAMATAIEDAIAALEYKLADYTAVDAAIEKANALNESSYTNFDTVKKAVDAVVRDKNITEQDAVNAMAKAIEDAINGLVRKSSGGGHTSSNNYAVDVPSQPENGSLAVSPKNASKGSTVTITVTPDSGYQLDTITATDAAGNPLKLTNTGDGKYTFTMPGSKVTVKASFAQTPETSPFTDVAANAYYYEAVKWAVGKNITGGVGNSLFAPDQPCTRAQMVTFLWRASGSPEPSGTDKFTDVPESAYYAKAVAWAVEKGITLGTSDTTFAPDLVCNRAQSVTFLYRALGTKTAQNADFRDVPANSYYTEAVAWASANDVTTGIGNGLFGPDADCTRAQIVTFLYRTMEK